MPKEIGAQPDKPEETPKKIYAERLGPVLRDDDMAETLAALGIGHGNSDRNKGPEKKPDEGKKPDEPQTPPPSTPPAPDPAAPPPKGDTPPATPPAPPQPDPAPPGPRAKSPTESLAESATTIAGAAKTIAEAAASTRQPAAPAAPPVDPKAQLRSDALTLLATEHPRYKGRDLAKELTTWNSAMEKYEEQWRAKHPDEEFDATAAEHSRWFDRNPVPIEEEVIQGAELTVMQSQRHAQELSRVREEQTWMLVNQEMQAETGRATSAVLDKLGKKSFEDLEPEQQLAAMGDRRYQGVVAETAALCRAAVFGAVYGLAPERDPSHAQLAGLVRKWESELPVEDKGHVSSGRTFCTVDEYGKLPTSEKQKRWTVLHFSDAVRNSLADLAKFEIEQETGNLKKRFKRAEPPAPTPSPPAPTPPPTPTPDQGNGKPPEGGGGGTRQPGLPPDGKPKLDVDHFFGPRA